MSDGVLKHLVSNHNVLFPIINATFRAACWPSRDMPRARHFCKRQNWQRLRFTRSMEQFPLRGHWYVIGPDWLRRKKPCNVVHHTDTPL